MFVMLPLADVVFSKQLWEVDCVSALEGDLFEKHADMSHHGERTASTRIECDVLLNEFFASCRDHLNTTSALATRYDGEAHGISSAYVSSR